MRSKTINAELVPNGKPKIPYGRSKDVAAVSAARHASGYAAILKEVISSSRLNRQSGFRGGLAYAFDRVRSVVGMDTHSRIVKALGAPSVSAIVELRDNEFPFCSARLETFRGDQQLNSNYLELNPVSPARPKVAQQWQTNREGLFVDWGSIRSLADEERAYAIHGCQRDLVDVARAGTLVMSVSVEAQS